MIEQSFDRYMVIEDVTRADEVRDEADVIAIVSWSWGGDAGDPGVGATAYGLLITREVDAASSRLLRLFDTGAPAAKASLYEYSTTSKGKRMTTQIALTNMTVVHYRRPGASPEDSRKEFGVRFDQAVLRYPSPHSDPGGRN